MDLRYVLVPIYRYCLIYTLQLSHLHCRVSADTCIGGVIFVFLTNLAAILRRRYTSRVFGMCSYSAYDQKQQFLKGRGRFQFKISTIFMTQQLPHMRTCGVIYYS